MALPVHLWCTLLALPVHLWCALMALPVHLSMPLAGDGHPEP